VRHGVRPSHGDLVKAAPVPATEPDPLLTVDQVARWLGKPKATLYAWRTRGLGPKAIRVGNVLRYRRSEVERWLDAHTDDRL
jgi:excisionase family DNA binding protein